jgi:hypothetical protein
MDGDYNNREEFLAMLTANIYVSAEGGGNASTRARCGPA